MLALGVLIPTAQEWTFRSSELVNLTPWSYAIPCACTLISCVVGLYLLFSPLGLVGGVSEWLMPLLGLLVLINLAIWARFAFNQTSLIDDERKVF